MKKFLSVFLCVCLITAAASCTKKPDASEVPPPAANASGEGASGEGAQKAAETRTITLGIWWDEYYDSTHTDIHSNPNVSDEIRAQAQLDNLREIEEKYNVRLKYMNLTWDGTIESINTSIMAGSPDCDIYMTDLQFGIPAVLNNYAIALESFLPADADVLGDQVIMRHLNVLGDSKNYLFQPTEKNAQGYPLGFNLTMIQEANLEDPRDLYDRGEWTWDKWREYLKVLKKDIDNDGVTDVYGYGGYWTNMLESMLLCNNAHIAGDKTEGLSKPETIAVLDFFNTIYNVDKTARPWNEADWESNLKPFVDGTMAFFVTKDWIIKEMADEGKALSWELGVVPWPYGPNGTKESSQRYNTGGNWLMIPVGTKDPELVYAFYADYVNWFKGDTSVRDEGGIADWQRDMYLTERNFDMAMERGKTSAFDIWGSLSDFSMVPIISGELTPAQYAEENKQVVQEQIDALFGG